jgi:excisionase family DNA binding protein
MTTSSVSAMNPLPQRRSNADGDALTTRPELIDVAALAGWLGIEIGFVRRLVCERRIPFIKIGRYVRFDPQEVQMWIDQQRNEVFDARSVRSAHI